MKQYKALMNPNKVKNEFLLGLILMLAPEKADYNEKSFNSKFRGFGNTSELIGITDVQKELIDKVKHILFYRGGMYDVVNMLHSFSRGTKRLRTNNNNERAHEDQYIFTCKDGNPKLSHYGNLPNAHFRWNSGERYTLSSEDLKRIELYIRPLIKSL